MKRRLSVNPILFKNISFFQFNNDNSLALLYMEIFEIAGSDSNIVFAIILACFPFALWDLQ
jgi:hypothetical protein